jgi:hypothetical protein
MILKGVALARAEGIEEKLSAYDCVYAPIGSVCSLKNVGTEDLYFLWMGPRKLTNRIFAATPASRLFIPCGTSRLKKKFLRVANTRFGAPSIVP